MTALPLDPFGAWEHLPAGWGFCPDCHLPTPDVKTHRRARSCDAITTIGQQFQNGNVMLPLSLNVPGSRTGRYLPAHRNRVSSRRRYAKALLPGTALWDVLLLAAVTGPLNRSDMPGIDAIRQATATIERSGRPTLIDQPSLHEFTITCEPAGAKGMWPQRPSADAATHTLVRDGDTITCSDHTNDQRAESFLAALTGQTADCVRLRKWWQQPDHRYADPVPFKAMWRDVDRYNEWRAQDVAPWIIDVWMQVGAGPQQAEEWTQAGYTPWEAYLASLFCVYPDNPDGYPFGRPADWRNAGADVLEARKWSGMSNGAVRLLFDQRGSWQHAGRSAYPFPVSAAREHIAAKRTYADALKNFASQQITQTESEEDKAFRTWRNAFLDNQTPRDN